MIKKINFRKYYLCLLLTSILNLITFHYIEIKKLYDDLIRFN